jgi:hypothetical protein
MKGLSALIRLNTLQIDIQADNRCHIIIIIIIPCYDVGLWAPSETTENFSVHKIV